jgi:hypothetical protein
MDLLEEARFSRKFLGQPRLWVSAPTRAAHSPAPPWPRKQRLALARCARRANGVAHPEHARNARGPMCRWGHAPGHDDWDWLHDARCNGFLLRWIRSDGELAEGEWRTSVNSRLSHARTLQTGHLQRARVA